MKYNLFDGHRPKQEPRYCKQYEAETLKMLKLTGMLLVVFIATLVAVIKPTGCLLFALLAAAGGWLNF